MVPVSITSDRKSKTLTFGEVPIEEVHQEHDTQSCLLVSRV